MRYKKLLPVCWMSGAYVIDNDGTEDSTLVRSEVVSKKEDLPMTMTQLPLAPSVSCYIST